MSKSESITVDSVAVVGEYTTPSGPWFDDHFVVVVFRSGKLIEIPSDQADQMIAELEKATGVKIELQLCNRTDATSRVIFPPTLEGNPLLKFDCSTCGFAGLLKLIRNFGISEIHSHITNEIRDYVAGVGEGRNEPTGQP